MSKEKQELKEYLNKCKPYIRFLPILKKLNIQQSNFSQFMVGKNEYAISEKKLRRIKSEIIEITHGIAINKI